MFSLFKKLISKFERSKYTFRYIVDYTEFSGEAIEGGRKFRFRLSHSPDQYGIGYSVSINIPARHIPDLVKWLSESYVGVEHESIPIDTNVLPLRRTQTDSGRSSTGTRADLE